MKPDRLPFHYAWVIAFCGALTLFACLGLARFAYGMLLPAMRSGLGLSYDEMGFVSTGNFAGYLAAVVLAPFLLRRLRPRALISGALILIALCMLGIGRSQSLTGVILLYALVGLGSGFANIPAMVLVSHWFRRTLRGRAAGLMIMGNGSAIIFSGLFIPFLNQQLGAQGWRVGWQVLALTTLIIALVAMLLLRNDPADVGSEPAGRRQPLPSSAAAVKEPTGGGRTLVVLGILYLVFGVTYMVYGSFIVTTMIDEFGFAEDRAGQFWAAIGFFSLFSGIGFGTVSDRLGRRGGLAVVFAVQTAAYLLAGAGSGTAPLLGSVVLYGLTVFAVPTIMAAAVGDYLGLSRAAAGFSTVTLFFAVGQVIGPGAAGLLAEASGTFTTTYLASAALTALALFLTVLLPRPASAGD